MCECDKRFAENIAKAQDNCETSAPADAMYGEHCMDEQWRTVNGGGNFVPQDSCDKQFHGHEKENCCGIYPNRWVKMNQKNLFRKKNLNYKPNYQPKKVFRNNF